METKINRTDNYKHNMKKQLIMIAALFVALGAANAQHDHGSNDKKKLEFKWSPQALMSTPMCNVTTYEKKCCTKVY